MTVSQANVVPITSNDALETVTLKNLVALDVVEKNESILKSLGLFADSKLKYHEQNTLTNNDIKQLIQQRSSEINILNEDISNLKKSLHNPSSLSNKELELIKKLSSEFLQDEIPADNTDALIAQFEKENGVNVVFDDSRSSSKRIDGSYLTKERDADSTRKDADDDVIIE